MTIELQFTSKDVDYLVQHFGIEQLRRERHNADVQQSVCNTLGLEEDQAYWRDYLKAVELALDIAVSNRPVPKMPPGGVDIDQLKASIDIVSIAERYASLRKSGRNFIGKCPFHDDRHPSFVIYPETGHFYCYGCQKSGDVIDLVMYAERCDFKAVIAILGSR